MPSASFIEILVDQIREEVREEVMQEFASAPRVSAQAGTAADEFVAASHEARVRAHQASQTELWLSLHLQPKTAPRGAYRAQAKSGSGISTASSATRSASSAASSVGSTTSERQQPAAPKQIASAQPLDRAERAGSAQTIPQILALEFFKREGAILETEFTESQFKKAFRTLALQLHPDRHAEASAGERENLQQRFSRLVECSDELASTLK